MNHVADEYPDGWVKSANDSVHDKGRSENYQNLSVLDKNILYSFECVVFGMPDEDRLFDDMARVYLYGRDVDCLRAEKAALRWMDVGPLLNIALPCTEAILRESLAASGLPMPSHIKTAANEVYDYIRVCAENLDFPDRKSKKRPEWKMQIDGAGAAGAATGTDPNGQ